MPNGDNNLLKRIVAAICVFVCIFALVLGVKVTASEAAEPTVVRIGYLDEFSPYSNFMHKKHVASGLIRFLVGRIEKDAGVKAKCVPYLNEAKMFADLKSGRLDTVFPVYGNQTYAKNMGIILSTPIEKSEMLLLYKGKDRPDLGSKIGVLSIGSFAKNHAELNFARNTISYFPDIVFAAQALEKGKISGILIQTRKYDVLKQDIPEEYKFNQKIYIHNLEICFAYAPKSPYAPLIDKVLNNISADEMRREILKETDNYGKLTWMDFVAEHVVSFSVLVLIVIGLMLAGFIWYYRVTKKTESVLVSSKLKAEEMLAKEKDLRHELEKAMFEAEHDSMTGLLNKGSFEALLETHYDNPNMACIIVDIDHFKSVNDIYGHEVGDEIIKCVAKAVRNSFRDSDYVARIGGDEYAVIIKDISPDKRELLAKRLENIRKVLEKISEGLPKVTLSVGVAFADDASRADAKEIFRHADSVLYKVKENGRDGFNFYN